MGCKGTHYFSNFHPIGRLLSSFKLLQCSKYAPKVALQLSGRMLLDGCVFIWQLLTLLPFTFYLHIIFLVVPSLIFTMFRPFCGELILCPLTL